MKRRRFLQTAATAAAAAAIPAQGQKPQDRPDAVRTSAPLGPEFLTSPDSNAAANLLRVTDPGTRRGDMLYRKLGSTGVEVSAIGLGGSHIGRAKLTDDESVNLIHSALDRGITFLDNSWDYNGGRSELLVGKALRAPGYREKAFVMTKIDGRTKQEANKQLDESLLRLGGHIDLLQFHEILRFEDPDRIFDEGGALEAVQDAKQAGKIRFIGFTGHKDPHIHLYMLDVAKRNGFHFDSAQMPLNVMDAHYRSFAQLVVPRLVAEGTAVLGMKMFGAADAVILKSNTVKPMECLHYGLNLPTAVVITGIDSPEILDQAFAATRTFQPMNEQQVAALIAKTQQAALTGHYEMFKTTSHFDTTARNPKWLGEEPEFARKLAPSKPS